MEDYAEDEYAPSKKSKKNKKQKKKKRTKTTCGNVEALKDSELMWEDPEKLVQLDKIVSMGSCLSR